MLKTSRRMGVLLLFFLVSMIQYFKITYLADGKGDWYVVRVKDNLAKVICYSKGYFPYKGLEYPHEIQDKKYFKTEELTRKQVKNLWVYEI